MRNNLIALSFLCFGCEVREMPEPIKVTKLTKVYSIQVQRNGNTWNPQYLPNIGK